MNLIVCETNKEQDILLAKEVSKEIKNVIEKKGRARILLSTAKEIHSFFNCLINEKIDWLNVEIFIAGEYQFMHIDNEFSSFRIIEKYFTEKVFPGKINYIYGQSLSNNTLKLLEEAVSEGEIDLAVINVEKGSEISFNYDYVDFNNKATYELVELGERDFCKQKENGIVGNDACLYKKAYTITCSGLLRINKLFAVASGMGKEKIVSDIINDRIDEKSPIVLLKKHMNSTLFVEKKLSLLK